jgi:hypothetical protein
MPVIVHLVEPRWTWEGDRYEGRVASLDSLLLVVAEGYHGVDAHGSAGGDVASQEAGG